MEKWDMRFMELAEQVATWSSCIRRKVGAVIVREKTGDDDGLQRRTGGDYDLYGPRRMFAH